MWLSKMEMQGWISDTWWHSWSWLRISPFPNLWWLGETSPPHDVLMHRGWRFGDGPLFALGENRYPRGTLGEKTWNTSMVWTGFCAFGLQNNVSVNVLGPRPLPSDVNKKLLANYVNQNDQTKPNPSGLPKEVIFDIVGTWYQPYPPPALWYPP